jgi:hypothetical protein
MPPAPSGPVPSAIRRGPPASPPPPSRSRRCPRRPPDAAARPGPRSMGGGWLAWTRGRGPPSVAGSHEWLRVRGVALPGRARSRARSNCAASPVARPPPYRTVAVGSHGSPRAQRRAGRSQARPGGGQHGWPRELLRTGRSPARGRGVAGRRVRAGRDGPAPQLSPVDGGWRGWHRTAPPDRPPDVGSPEWVRRRRGDRPSRPGPRRRFRAAGWRAWDGRRGRGRPRSRARVRGGALQVLLMCRGPTAAGAWRALRPQRRRPRCRARVRGGGRTERRDPQSGGGSLVWPRVWRRSHRSRRRGRGGARRGRQVPRCRRAGGGWRGSLQGWHRGARCRARVRDAARRAAVLLRGPPAGGGWARARRSRRCRTRGRADGPRVHPVRSPVADRWQGSRRSRPWCHDLAGPAVHQASGGWRGWPPAPHPTCRWWTRRPDRRRGGRWSGDVGSPGSVPRRDAGSRRCRPQGGGARRRGACGWREWRRAPHRTCRSWCRHRGAARRTPARRPGRGRGGRWSGVVVLPGSARRQAADSRRCPRSGGWGRRPGARTRAPVDGESLAWPRQEPRIARQVARPVRAARRTPGVGRRPGFRRRDAGRRGWRRPVLRRDRTGRVPGRPRAVCARVPKCRRCGSGSRPTRPLVPEHAACRPRSAERPARRGDRAGSGADVRPNRCGWWSRSRRAPTPARSVPAPRPPGVAPRVLRPGHRAARSGRARPLRTAPRGPACGHLRRWVRGSAEHGPDRPPRHLLSTCKGRARVTPGPAPSMTPAELTELNRFDHGRVSTGRPAAGPASRTAPARSSHEISGMCRWSSARLSRRSARALRRRGPTGRRGRRASARAGPPVPVSPGVRADRRHRRGTARAGRAGRAARRARAGC